MNNLFMLAKLLEPWTTRLTNTLKGNTMDQVDKIIAYESGELDNEQTIALFQELIDSGLVWQLQGSYGRSAIDLINAGLCSRP
jgi:hypothetical protein